MPGTIQTLLLEQFYIYIAGSIPEGLTQEVRRVEVHLGRGLPDMCEFEINDPELRWVDDVRLKPGQEVEVKVGTQDVLDASGRQAQALFKGQIASLEADLAQERPAAVVVRCYDRSHLLHRGTKVRAFVQATDSDIARKVAQENGLQATVDATSEVHTQIFQDNVTDFEFLTERARAVGYVFYVDDRTVHFKKPASLGDGPELDYGTDLIEFHPQLSMASQVSEATVRSWDPKTKRAIVGKATSADFKPVEIGDGKRGWERAQQAFGDPGQLLITDQPVASQAEGDALAKASLAGLWARDVRAEGIAHGHAGIKPGYKVTVKNVGTLFSGKYLVTSVRHLFDQLEGYQAYFSVTGFSTETAADLVLAGAAPGQTAAGRVVQGIALAVVTNNQDPEKQGRVKVKYPWLDEALESDWIRLSAPTAGPDRGFFFIPEVNDEVVVAFEQGDINRGVIVGALWNGKDKPPEANAVSGGTVNKRVIKSRSGHTITLDDTGGAEKISIVDKTGGNKIVIDSGPGTLTISVKGNVTVESATGDVTVKGMNITVEGQAKVELKAPQIEIAASARAKISGAMVELN